MICKICNFENEENARFCEQCGEVLNDGESFNTDKKNHRLIKNILLIVLAVLILAAAGFGVKKIFFSKNSLSSEQEIIAQFNSNGSFAVECGGKMYYLDTGSKSTTPGLYVYNNGENELIKSGVYYAGLISDGKYLYFGRVEENDLKMYKLNPKNKKQEEFTIHSDKTLDESAVNIMRILDGKIYCNFYNCDDYAEPAGLYIINAKNGSYKKSDIEDAQIITDEGIYYLEDSSTKLKFVSHNKKNKKTVYTTDGDEKVIRVLFEKKKDLYTICGKFSSSEKRGKLALRKINIKTGKAGDDIYEFDEGKNSNYYRCATDGKKIYAAKEKKTTSADGINFDIIQIDLSDDTSKSIGKMTLEADSRLVNLDYCFGKLCVLELLHVSEYTEDNDEYEWKIEMKDLKNRN